VEAVAVVVAVAVVMMLRWEAMVNGYWLGSNPRWQVQDVVGFVESAARAEAEAGAGARGRGRG